MGLIPEYHNSLSVRCSTEYSDNKADPLNQKVNEYKEFQWELKISIIKGATEQ